MSTLNDRERPVRAPRVAQTTGPLEESTQEDESVLLVGWDAAVDPRNTAVVLACYRGGSGEVPSTLEIQAHRVPTTHDDLVATVSSWAREDIPTLLCVDSPLGWPAALGKMLREHVAGTTIPASADTLFRRVTDIDVRRRVGKTPLDIGADRIARTALATLSAIEAIRGRLSRPIDLPIDIQDPRMTPNRILLLESYPAGWFASEAIITRGYRPVVGGDHRRELLRDIERRLSDEGISLSYGVDREALLRRADDLDALVCTLNGIDYLRGKCPAPEAYPEDTIRREGWIWCKDRSQLSGRSAP